MTGSNSGNEKIIETDGDDQGFRTGSFIEG